VNDARYINASQQNLFNNYPNTSSYGQLPYQTPLGISQESHKSMIQQYESVLQSLNHEFKNSLEQNKILQEETIQFEQIQIKHKRLINDLRVRLDQKEGGGNIEALITEKNEIRFVNEHLSNEVLELRLKWEILENENIDYKSTNSSLSKINDKYRDNEFYMQQKYDEMRHKLAEKDSMLRHKDEIIFGVTRENEALKADIRNLENVEEALKTEIDDLVGKRKSLEDINQKMKNQI
jgi:hypothetical protein